MASGIINPPIEVGTKLTCPPGKNCIGKAYGQSFCAVFGQDLQRARDKYGKYKPGPTGGHMYIKCSQCIAAGLNQPLQQKEFTPIAGPVKDLDVYKDI